MKLREFLIQFAETHNVQHIDDITEGIITGVIAEEIYLVKTSEVHE